jgi:UDP-4-amino-4,6-dideoxy-N-acetyl-beta-L-altrosamine transaminase
VSNFNFIPYGRQWIDEADIAAVNAVLTSDYLTQGPVIEEFENEIRKITRAKFCIAVSNATVGLHIAVAALELESGAEGITTPITFVASANCLASNSLIPVFADIDSKTYNISPAEIEKKITPETKILIPVDFAGQAVDIEEIKNIADKHNLYIIEDAAHAIGSFYRDGMQVGCSHKADMTVFSFHPVKTITSGEGGAITTNNEQIYKKLLKLRTIGITKNVSELSQNPGAWYYETQILGTNARLTDIQAALGKSQISKLQLFIERRREIVKKYNEAFAKIPYLTIPCEESKNSSCFHLYVLQMDFEKIAKPRQKVMQELKEKGIGTQVHYIPVNSQPYYTKNFGTYNPKHFPIANAYYQKTLSLPLYPKMTDYDVDRVICAVKEL